LADGIAGNFDMTLKTIGVLANAEGLNGTHIRLGVYLGIGGGRIMDIETLGLTPFFCSLTAARL
jgi:hypothetical protein